MDSCMETGVAYRIAPTVLKEIEEIYSRIRARADEIFTTRGGGDYVMDVEDWMMAERQIITKPPARVIQKDDRIEITFDLAGVDPADVELVVTPHSVLVWSPRPVPRRRVFRLLNPKIQLLTEGLESRLIGTDLIISAPVSV